MAKRPPLKTSLWQRTPLRWRNMTKMAAGVVAITGAIVGVAKAWPYVEPYLLAHRGYVIEHIGGVQATTNELLIWKFEDAKSRSKADMEGWTIQMQKENDPQTRTLIQRRIEQLNVEQQQYDQRIRALRGP